MMPGNGRGEQRRRVFAVVIFAFLIGLLTWFYIRADQVSPEQHYRYMLTLRHVQEADVEVNSAVVANYANLLQNYDALIRHLQEIRSERANLLHLPPSLPHSHRRQLEQKINQLLAAQKAKEDDVDRFQRAHAVLRNSEAYFPKVAEDLLEQPSTTRLQDLQIFIRKILAVSNGNRGVDGDDLPARISQLRRPGWSGESALLFNQLMVHASLIIERRPQVDALVSGIVTAPTGAMADEIAHLYIQAYEQAQQVAATYRSLLYGIAMLLALYMIYAVFRMRQDALALTQAHADLEERYEAQRQTEGELALYANVFSNAAEGMTITGRDGRIVAVNPTFCRITGYEPADVLGRKPGMLSSGRQSREFYQSMWDELLAKGHWQGEIWNRRKDGGIYPEWLSISAVYNDASEVTHYIGVFQDISERKQSEARIHHLAHHDALTGLPNRLLLEDRLNQGMLKSKRNKKSMAVVFIDLDRFKNINDTLGHEMGDKLLIEAAQRGLGVLRDTDTLSRQGGDEFVAVLPELEHRQDVMHVTRKLLAAICQPYQLAGHQLTVSGSAGIALYPEDGETVSELLRKADAAMYRAKDEGRNTFRFFSSEINTASLGELLLENDLRGALERNELVLHYQPKIDAVSGEIVGAEALMRWQHREQGVIPPGRFIPLAEESGLIEKFGQWAIETVCAQQRRWLDAGVLAVPIAVNISANQFARADFPNMIAHCLAEHGIPPQLLELEMTESMLMRNSSHTVQVLQTLRNMHIQLSIDDFGTGYSSLSYLKQFPVQILKIDRSFVCEIDEQGERVRLASAIIAMAHELDMAVVAEGVETEAQSQYLREHGCDQFQGYLFGRPQPVEELGRLLAGRRLEGLDD